jgi:uncharacterized protein YraI
MTRFRRRSFSVLAGAAIASLAVGVAMAEQVWVKSESVEIRGGKGAVYPVVGTAAKGAALEVLGHEGKWLKVKVGEKQGYVFENAISAEEVGGGGNLLAAVGAGSNASEMSSSASAKGLEQDAQVYADQKNLNPAPLNKLIQLRNQITPQQWEAFTAEGKVGPAAP